MSAVESCSKTLDFYPPANLDAIRSTLLQRIYQKRQESTSVASSPTSPISSTATASLLEHGLPSPPVEYEKKKPTEDYDHGHCLEYEQQPSLEDEEDDALSTISSLPPTIITTGAPDASSPTPKIWNAEQVTLKIKQLQEEKHRLFTQMKNLIQQQQQQTPASKNIQPTEENDKPMSLPSPSPSPTTTPRLMSPFKQHPFKQYYQPRRRQSSTPLMSPNVIPSRYTTTDGRPRYSPYDAYFPPPPGYNVRHRPSSTPRPFRPSRFLVNRHLPRY